MVDTLFFFNTVTILSAHSLTTSLWVITNTLSNSWLTLSINPLTKSRFPADTVPNTSSNNNNDGDDDDIG